MVRKRQQAHCRSDNTRLEAIFHSLEVTHKVFQMFRVPQLVTIEHHDVTRWRDARSLCSRALRVELLPGEIRRTPTSNDMADTQRTFPGRPAGPISQARCAKLFLRVLGSSRTCNGYDCAK